MKWTHAATAALSVLAACAAQQGGLGGAGAPADFAGIPNVTFDYYDVAGTSAAEVRRSIDALRPTDSNDGQKVDAMTRWTIDWIIPTVRDGRCRLKDAKLRFRASVILPRLKDEGSLPPADLARWQTFAAGLAKHESWHVRDAYAGLPDVERAIRQSACAEAAAAAARAVRAIGQRQLDYDRATRHGADEVIPFP